MQTGIPEGLPVYASGADKACEVLAAGAWTPELAVLSYGTTATINTCNSRYVEPIPFLPPYPAAAPGRYNSEIMVQRGYWMVNWFKEQFAANEVIEAEKQGVAPEVLFERMLETTPPGNMGLILQPFWNPGVRIPGPEAKGAMIGFGDVHNRAHMYRAIVEGIAYALREAAARLERRNGVKIRAAESCGRRLAKRRRHANDRRYLRHPRRAAAHLRNLRAWRRHERRRWRRALRQPRRGAGADEPAWAHIPAAGRKTRSFTPASIPACT